MKQLLGTALMTVNHLSLVVPGGQRTIEFIVHVVDLGRESSPHVLNSILECVQCDEKLVNMIV